MIKKLSCILLVDDDRATNYLHELIIKRLDCTDKIIVKRDGVEALDFLSSKAADGCHPQLILLDINMPRMNGWEFLEEYVKLPSPQHAVAVAILTSSLNPDDEAKAKKYYIKTFKNKPLTTESMLAILKENFG